MAGPAAQRSQPAQAVVGQPCGAPRRWARRCLRTATRSYATTARHWRALQLACRYTGSHSCKALARVCTCRSYGDLVLYTPSRTTHSPSMASVPPRTQAEHT